MTTREQEAARFIPDFWPTLEWREIQEAKERRLEMIGAIALPEHVRVQQLNPAPIMNIPQPGSVPLAMRQSHDRYKDESLLDYYDRKLDQHLHAVVRVGSFAFGVAGIYGKAVPGGSAQFVVMLTESPHMDRPRVIAPLQRGYQIELSGKNRKTPELGEMGHNIVIRGTLKGKIGIINKGLCNEDLQYITAVSVPKKGAPNRLMDEIGTWAAPADGVLRSLKRGKNAPGLKMRSQRAHRMKQRTVYA